MLCFLRICFLYLSWAIVLKKYPTKLIHTTWSHKVLFRFEMVSLKSRCWQWICPFQLAEMQIGALDEIRTTIEASFNFFSKTKFFGIFHSCKIEICTHTTYSFNNRKKVIMNEMSKIFALLFYKRVICELYPTNVGIVLECHNRKKRERKKTAWIWFPKRY